MPTNQPIRKLFHPAIDICYINTFTGAGTVSYHRWGWSDAEGVDAKALDEPFSGGGATPHLPSDSSGSNIWTPPSERPTANILDSCGWAAITSGWTFELLQTHNGDSRFTLFFLIKYQDCSVFIHSFTVVLTWEKQADTQRDWLWNAIEGLQRWIHIL